MSTLLPDVTQTAYDEARTFIVEVIKEIDPTIDTAPGSVLDGLLIGNQAQMQALQEADLDNWRLRSSLAAAAENLVVLTDAEVDQLVSNYRLVRRSASQATGPVQFIVDQLLPYSLPAGYQLRSGEQLVSVPAAVRVYPPGQGIVETPTTRVLSSRPDGTWEFTVTVQADTAGPAGRLQSGTVLTALQPITGVLSTTVAVDFTGGASQETNQELLDAAQEGLTAQVLDGPDSIQAALNGTFPGIQSFTLGVGNELMKRDRGNLLGFSSGGKQDVYIRTSVAPQTKTVTVVGTVVNAATRRILAYLPVADQAGFYRCLAIRPSGSTAISSVQPASVQRSIYTGTAYVPTFVTAADTAFGPNQSISLQWIDQFNSTPLTDGQTISYDIDIAYMPLTAEVSDWFQAKGRRMEGVDSYVRAGCPANVTLQLVLSWPVGVARPSTDLLKARIVDAVGQLGFDTPQLTSYVIHRAIADLVVRGNVLSTVLRGMIWCPVDETNLPLPAGQTLTIPERPDLYIGADNSFFALSASGIEISYA